MSEPFVAEIRIMGFTYAPRGWATCDGQVLPINQNVALYSLLGTTFGGDGKTTFALPNLQGRAPMAAGNGPGLTSRYPGASGGTQTVTLTPGQMAAHTHNVTATAFEGDYNTPGPDKVIATIAPSKSVTFASGGTNTPMNPAMIGVAGSGQAHNNMQAYQTLLFAIALQGMFPSRS